MTARVTPYRRPDGSLAVHHHTTGTQIVTYDNAAQVATDIAQIATGKAWSWLPLADQNERSAFYLNRLVTLLQQTVPARPRAVA